MKINIIFIVFVVIGLCIGLSLSEQVSCGRKTCINNSKCNRVQCDRKDDCEFITVVKCTGQTKCTRDVCNSSTGQCYAIPKTCDDNIGCTDDVCDEINGCVSTPNNATCLTDKCNTGECTLTGCAKKDCSTKNKCLVSSGCDKLTGECKTTPKICNDKIDCTEDSCDPNIGCVYTPIDSKCNDNNACTQNDKCTSKGCVFESEKKCDSPNKCQISSGCDKITGQCQIKPVECDTSNKCITNVCNPDKGICEATSTVKCPPKKVIDALGIVGVLCQSQVCQPSTGKCIDDGSKGTSLLC